MRERPPTAPGSPTRPTGPSRNCSGRRSQVEPDQRDDGARHHGRQHHVDPVHCRPELHGDTDENQDGADGHQSAQRAAAAVGGDGGDHRGDHRETRPQIARQPVAGDHQKEGCRYRRTTMWWPAGSRSAPAPGRSPRTSRRRAVRPVRWFWASSGVRGGDDQIGVAAARRNRLRPASRSAGSPCDYTPSCVVAHPQRCGRIDTHEHRGDMGARLAGAAALLR